MYFVATRHLHDLTWWIILFTGLWAVFRVWRGRLARLPWTRRERLAGLVFSSSLAIQFLIGLALYFQSPLVHALFAGGAAGLDPQSAIFFGLLHPLIMFTAVVLGQVGFSVSKRLGDDRRKYVIATGCYTVRPGGGVAGRALGLVQLWKVALLPYHVSHPRMGFAASAARGRASRRERKACGDLSGRQLDSRQKCPWGLRPVRQLSIRPWQSGMGDQGGDLACRLPGRTGGLLQVSRDRGPIDQPQR